jgi:hypothetical protein
MPNGEKELVRMPVMFVMARLPGPHVAPPSVDRLNPMARSVKGDALWLMAHTA